MAVVALETLTFGLSHLSAAAAARGHELHLLTRDRSIYAFELEGGELENVVVVDVETHDPERTVTALKNIPGLAGLINSTDTWSGPAVEIAGRLGLPSQDRGSVELVRDKTRLRQHLHRAGLSRGGAVDVVPGHVDSALVEREIGFPLVLKDSSGTSSKNVWLVQGTAELLDAASRVESSALHGGKLTAEPYFSGPLYSAETLSWEGGTRLLGVSGRRLSAEPNFREEAVNFPIRFSADWVAEISEWVSSVLSEVGYSRGFSHTEFILTENGPEVVEINPRIGGALVGEAMNRTYGINVYEAFVDMALGKRPEIMDHELRPLRGISQILMYPEKAGTFAGYRGLEKIEGHLGDPEIYPVRFPGDRVDHITDQRGNVGILLASGSCSEEAEYNASACAGKVRPLTT